MKSVFKWIDSFKFKANIFRNASYVRGWAFLFVLCMIPLWFALGFDSGVGMIEEAFKALISGENVSQKAFSVYGMTFHFSSYVIYGLLFVGLSLHLESLDIKGSRNVAYSGVLGILNIGVFEMVYMALFATFQMNRNPLRWFVEDFFLAPVATNFSFVIFGLMALFYLWVDSYKMNSNEIVGRNYRFKLDREMVVVGVFCLASVLLWIFYPFPVKPLVIGDWKSSRLFPQTHYAYMRSNVHMSNDLLHLVNFVVKALFALTQLAIIRGLQNVDES